MKAKQKQTILSKILKLTKKEYFKKSEKMESADDNNRAEELLSKMNKK